MILYRIANKDLYSRFQTMLFHIQMWRSRNGSATFVFTGWSVSVRCGGRA